MSDQLYPFYDVVIRDMATCEERIVRMDQGWFESSMFWWTEGNFACDCNRAIQYHGKYAADWPCGDSRFMVLKAIFPDGTEIEIEHIHVFDSEVYALRYCDSSRKPICYSGAVDIGCACGTKRLFTPSDGQPTASFWGVEMGRPNPPLPSQPPHLAWEVNLR